MFHKIADQIRQDKQANYGIKRAGDILRFSFVGKMTFGPLSTTCLLNARRARRLHQYITERLLTIRDSPYRYLWVLSLMN